jgi:hypothetical protein
MCYQYLLETVLPINNVIDWSNLAMAASDSVDISKVLTQLGVDPEEASKLNNKMNGVDYLNLANAINDDSPRGQAQAKQILTKYGVSLSKVPKMENTRLESIFSGIRQGKAFDDAAIMEHVRPVSEMNNRAAQLSGYSSYVRAANDTDADMLRDWLDENEIDYQNNDKHTFLVQSADREATYKLNHFMGRMNGKTHVMDNTEEVEEAKKMTKDLPKSRNPFAQHAAKKSGGGVHVDKEKKRDVWDRSAKHKKANVSESLNESCFTQGEIVEFGENKVPVHIPSGPNGTIGLLIDGKVKMVREGDITRTDEGVMGMTKIDPLYRLRELAGLRGPAIQEDDFETDPIGGDLDVADDFDDVDPMGGEQLGAEPVDVSAPADGEFDMDPMGGDSGLGDVDPMGGVPGDLPPMGADGAMGMAVEPPQSQAYSEILDHLNNIQASLGDVKLSEYRSLVAKLEDLAVQIKGMGRDYLGEMRKRK